MIIDLQPVHRFTVTTEQIHTLTWSLNGPTQTDVVFIIPHYSHLLKEQFTQT